MNIFSRKRNIKVFLTNYKKAICKEVSFTESKCNRNIYYIELENGDTIKVEVTKK